MNKLFFLGIFTGLCLTAKAQVLKSISDKLKKKAETLLDKKADQLIESAVDKSEKLVAGVYQFNSDSIPKPGAATVQALRSDLLKEGKWLTNDIAFDPTRENPDPGSMGIVKEMAALLYENPKLKLKIVGLPGAVSQQDLDSSMAIATSIKLLLMNQFGIDPGRMLIDTKPATAPAGKNTTGSGITPRNQVTFIKL